MTVINRAAEAALTPEMVRDALVYDPITGIFKWRKTMGRRAKAGAETGRVENTGYIRIRIYGRDYVAHRLAWAYMTGSWPDDLIDHRDQNRSNNRWDNLRPADSAGNNRNRKFKGNASGLKGAYLNKRAKTKMWNSSIQVDGRQIHLGTFDTAEEASAAYAEAVKKYHGEFGCLEGTV